MSSSFPLLLFLFLASSTLTHASPNFSCYTCSDCRTTESPNKVTPCNESTSSEHPPYCVTTVLQDNKMYRGCGDANMPFTEGCLHPNDEYNEKGKIDFICSCNTSECNAPKGTGQRNMRNGGRGLPEIPNEDKKGKAFFTKYGGWLIGGLIIAVVLVGIIIVSMKLGCTYCPSRTWCPQFRQRSKIDDFDDKSRPDTPTKPKQIPA